MTPMQPSQKYHDLYSEFFPRARDRGNFVEHQLRAKLRDYFWPNEDIPSVSQPRIKDRAGFFKKITKKGVDQENVEAMMSAKTDLIGVRIIVTFREHIERIVRMLRDEKYPWEIRHAMAYTNDTAEADFYRNLGLDVETKPTGYCGIHFDVFLPGEVAEPHWVEIQVRTKIQDAWQSIDHLVYKAEKYLPKEFATLRKSFAGQFEAAEKAQRFVFDHVQGQVLATQEYLKFGDLYKLFDWSKTIGIPKDFKDRLIGSAHLPWYWWVAPDDGARYSLVLENPKMHSEGQPLTLITTEYLKQNHPSMLEKMVILPDEFIADIPLAGNVEFCSFI